MEPDSTAVRVALWRALHVAIDPPPHVLEDLIGFKLVAPGDGWRSRPDMHPYGTRFFRACMVARARFVEDLVVDQACRGLRQYVILGAGLDSFAQRRPEMASSLKVFEIDHPRTQVWKSQRLIQIGFDIPEWLRFVPVDFDADGFWLERLKTVGFDARQPAVVSSMGVSMYLTKDAVAAMLRQVAGLAPGSTLVMTFFVPFEFAELEERPVLQAVERSARATGTPFISFFAPPEILALAREAGFREAQCFSAISLTQRYFAGRRDGLRPGSAEALLIATT